MISVLIPSYRNPTGLADCLASILRTVSDTRNIEILIRIDNDDPKSLEYKCLEEFNKRAFNPNWNIKFIESKVKERGYENLHLFVNELASQANGDWLMLLTDDSIIRSKNWDLEINKYYPRDLVVLNPCGQGLNLFPIVAYSVYDILGHISLNSHYDTWISSVAHENGKQIRLNNGEIQIEHLGKVNNHTETSNAYYSKEMRDLLQKDILQLKLAISMDKANEEYGQALKNLAEGDTK